MNKSVSAIITTCNRFELFKKALNSIKNQTYKNIEIIVVDGGEDKLLESYIKKYPDVIYITSDSQHPNILRNMGITYATGEWVAFLDDDDTWMPEKIELQIQCFKKNNIDLCYTGKNIVHKNGKIIKYSYHNAQFSSALQSIMWDNFIGTTSSIMLSKKTIIEVGMFDKKFPALQDYDLYIRICKSHRVKGINKPLVGYLNKHSNNQISNNKNNFQRACILLEQKYKNWKYSSILIIGLAKLKLKRTIKNFYE